MDRSQLCEIERQVSQFSGNDPSKIAALAKKTGREMTERTGMSESDLMQLQTELRYKVSGMPNLTALVTFMPVDAPTGGGGFGMIALLAAAAILILKNS